MDERYFEQEISHFSRLSRASFDTSSVIVLDSLGLIDQILRTIRVSITPGVHRELGHTTNLGSKMTPYLYQGTFEPDTSVDNEVIQLAYTKKLSIVSEDRRILQAGESFELPTYTSGILISYLVFSHSLSGPEGRRHWEEMRVRYPYRKDLDKYCEGLLTYLERCL